MHFPTITSALLLGLMATAPAIAKPVDFHALAARADGPISTLHERAVEGSLIARHHKGRTGGNGGQAASAPAGTQAQQAQAQQASAAAGATDCAQTGNQKRHHKGQAQNNAGNANAAAAATNCQ
ncbi:hypothetical protein P171DRAFT_521462 [Karstenula rhodostoma CBS 690.94]|uniref:Uncharacterized protein n=1 Tax=Karstenula rhodostoma CBS 690.94 TaxID=1392251 RepID=A0A9P4UCE5_9PLEO|nr:hypothetical protein P171DRAFT_521462 [Karstenula rhodostoma CBS 690.94]